MIPRVSRKTKGTFRENHGESLHEAERRYRALVRLSPNALIVHIDGRIVYANPAALRMARVAEESSLMGQSIYDFVTPDSRWRIEERIRTMLRTGTPSAPIEVSAVRKDGTSFEVEVISAPVPWEGETAIQVILHDITDRKRFEAALRESEARFHQLADSMPQIVWSAGPDGIIDYQNQKFFEQTGLTPAEAKDRNIWRKILHPDDVEPTTERWNDCVRLGIPFQTEYRYINLPSQAYRWHLGRALPVRDDSGRITRWYGTCTDIHDRKEMEFALRDAKDELAHTAQLLEQQVARRTEKLQTTVQSMEEFCYTIAHNLRAPLRAMQGFASAMLEEHAAELDQSGQDYAVRIERAASNMDQLIHDLLTYGRLSHQEVQQTDAPLEPVIRGVVSLFEHEIQRRAASVQINQVNFTVRADIAILQQILSNILNNALKFSRPDVPANVQIWAESRRRFVHIRIKDNGIGIPIQHQSRIFKPFERLHTQEQFPGTGIGLAIAAKGIQRLGGKIGLKSEVDKGSCFWIEIPGAGFNAPLSSHPIVSEGGPGYAKDTSDLPKTPPA